MVEWFGRQDYCFMVKLYRGHSLATTRGHGDRMRDLSVSSST